MGCSALKSDPDKITSMMESLPAALPCNAQVDVIQKIVGRATKSVSGNVLMAPISDRPCVYYSVTLETEQANRSSAGGSEWTPMLQETFYVDFMLTDDSGGAVNVVTSEGVKVTARETAADEQNGWSFSDPSSEPSPAFSELLKRHGKSATNFFGGNKRIRARESVLEVGEPGGKNELGQPVAVIGMVTAEGEQKKLTPKGAGNFGKTVIISDSPHHVDNMISRWG